MIETKSGQEEKTGSSIARILKAVGGQLAFVEGINNERVVYHLSEDKKHEEVFEKFSEKLSGAVVVFEAAKDSGEKGYRQLR